MADDLLTFCKFQSDPGFLDGLSVGNGDFRVVQGNLAYLFAGLFGSMQALGGGFYDGLRKHFFLRKRVKQNL